MKQLEENVEVRSTTGAADGQCGLFATREFHVGDVIVANEPPLLVLEEREWQQAELSVVLTKLKSAFDAAIQNDDKRAKAILDLYCPSPQQLNRTVFRNERFDYEKVDNLARQLYPDFTMNKNDDSGTTTSTLQQHKLALLLCIWKINSTRYGVDGNQSALLELHARMNHSCSPNAVYYASTIRAQKYIAKGDEITHCYIGMERAIASTRIRRDLLLEQCYFTCKCPRCCRSQDLSRVMKCPSCGKHALVPGLSSMDSPEEDTTTTKSDTTQKGEVGTCALCKETFDLITLPLAEERELENQTTTLWTATLHPTRETQIVVHQLHQRVLTVLGACHWTAAALTKIRYDTDPMINGFIILQWGEAHAKWCQHILQEDLPALAPFVTFTIGKNCQPLVSKPPNTQQKLFEISGRRYWNDCYGACRQLWGDGDAKLVDMKTMLAQSKAANVRVDMIVCTDKLCRAYTNDVCITATSGRSATATASTSKKACSACGFAHYCNKSCQRQDWSAHKEVCKSVRALKDLGPAVDALRAVGRF